MASLSEMELYSKTVYAEARGEPHEGQRWVAWVIKNRAHVGRFGGHSIKEVCLKPKQFSCWNGKTDIAIYEPGIYRNIQVLCEEIHRAPISADPTDKSLYYINPDLCDPAWAKKLKKTRKIGHHQFFKE
ncbi:spore cortex-lytic enzyme-like [Culicoides brevitarsis]|uniref:spore cortex-lytic enzyme-like n=1 Tax=Culicoides brevitarsis TaxID=469753 RepID=UPI00307C338E